MPGSHGGRSPKAKELDGDAADARGALFAVSVGKGLIEVRDALSGDERARVDTRSLGAGNIQEQLLAATDMPRVPPEHNTEPL